MENVKAFLDAINKAQAVRREGHLHQEGVHQLHHGPRA